VFEIIKNNNVIFWEACEGYKEEEKREASKGLAILEAVDFLPILTQLERVRDWSCHRYHEH
jgi:hypothetical protein